MKLFSSAAVSPKAQSVILLIVRVLLGVILIAHGWQKFSEWTIAGTTASFEGMGVPLPTISAWFAASVELGGGVLLIFGLLTRIVSFLLIADMIGAWWFVHRGAEVLVANGGWELVALIGMVSALLFAFGPGKFSIDALISPAPTTTE